jgi:hypothetical protein
MLGIGERDRPLLQRSITLRARSKHFNNQRTATYESRRKESLMLRPRRDLDLDVDEFLAIRKAEGLRIDPRTAEVTWVYAEPFDPYGIYEVPEEHQLVGREYFARAPGSEIWVNFGDLPHETRRALWEAHHPKLGFPGSLPFGLFRPEKSRNASPHRDREPN